MLPVFVLGFDLGIRVLLTALYLRHTRFGIWMDPKSNTHSIQGLGWPQHCHMIGDDGFTPGTVRNLRTNDLGGVIFGCKNATMKECLAKQLFG